MNDFFRSTRVRIVAGALALLVGGGVLGAVLATAIPAAAAGHTANTTFSPSATTPTNGQYCTLYEQTLAQKLGVSVSTLESDNVAAIQAVIAQMVKDGKLTQTQADQITTQLTANGMNVCSHIGQFLGKGRHGGSGGGFGAFGPELKQIRTDVQTAVAKQLGYSNAAALDTALANTDIVSLAKTKNVSQTQLNSTITTTVKTDLDAAVKASTITSAQETQVLTMLQSQLTAGHYNLFFGHGHGPQL